jgi:hypothetical protein
MCKGLSEALVSPDPKMVHDAAKALALLFMSMEALQVLCSYEPPRIPPWAVRGNSSLNVHY